MKSSERIRSKWRASVSRSETSLVQFGLHAAAEARLVSAGLVRAYNAVSQGTGRVLPVDDHEDDC